MSNQDQTILTDSSIIIIKGKEYTIPNQCLKLLPMFENIINGDIKPFSAYNIDINIDIDNDENINVFFNSLCNKKITTYDLNNDFNTVLDLCKLMKYFCVDTNDLTLSITQIDMLGCTPDVDKLLLCLNEFCHKNNIIDASPFIGIICGTNNAVDYYTFTCLNDCLRKEVTIQLNIKSSYSVFSSLKEKGLLKQHYNIRSYVFDKHGGYSSRFYYRAFNFVIKNIKDIVDDLHDIPDNDKHYVISNFCLNSYIISFLFYKNLRFNIHKMNINRFEILMNAIGLSVTTDLLTETKHCFCENNGLLDATGLTNIIYKKFCTQMNKLIVCRPYPNELLPFAEDTIVFGNEFLSL